MKTPKKGGRPRKTQEEKEAKYRETQEKCRSSGKPRHLYQCPCCDFVFNVKIHFKLHLSHFHGDVESYKCKECSESLKDGPALIEHILKCHTQTKNIPCNFCNRMFRTKYELNNHVSKNHWDTCPACYQPMSNRGEVQLGCHECKLVDINSHDFVSATCYKCRIFFPDKKMLPAHLEKCQPFQCFFCNKTRSTEESLGSHVRRHMQCMKKGQGFTPKNPGTEVPCEVCGRMCRSKEAYRAHMKTHTREYLCTVCGMALINKKHLKDHMASQHLAPVKCHLCGKMIKGNCLPNHLKYTHSDTRNFSCTFCGKCFKDSGTRNKHEQSVHSTTINHFCPEFGCGKAFNHKGKLQQHLRVTHRQHVAEECTECRMTFPTTQLYKKHRFVVHHETEEGRAMVADVPRPFNPLQSEQPLQEPVREPLDQSTGMVYY